MASVRIGASRHGNRSSSPAVSTTSPLMSARIAPAGNVRQAAARPRPTGLERQRDADDDEPAHDAAEQRPQRGRGEA